jgi:hypothetical protein
MFWRREKPWQWCGPWNERWSGRKNDSARSRIESVGRRSRRKNYNYRNSEEFSRQRSRRDSGRRESRREDVRKSSSVMRRKSKRYVWSTSLPLDAMDVNHA